MRESGSLAIYWRDGNQQARQIWHTHWPKYRFFARFGRIADSWLDQPFRQA
jgi:hypothetical protein